jgi:hypothetical protein
MKAVSWRGLDAFQKQLRTIGPTLLEDADQILRDSATAAKADIVAAYPRGPLGNLKRGVKILNARGSSVRGVDLKQTAPHGHLYEYGTVVRETKAGAHRNRMFAKQGFPDGRPTFGPIAAHHQRLALLAVVQRIQAEGASVDGEADVDLGAGSRLL